MKLQLTLLTLLLFSAKIFACRCDIKPNFKTQADLNEYSFIAHVKITEVKLAVTVKSALDAHQMSFELLELCKGESRDNILVYGSHASLKNQTSCDLGENVGEEWVIFGYIDPTSNKLTTGLCTRSRNIKKLNGYEELYYPNELTLKQQLQQLFDMPPIQKKYEGLRTKYFQNGSKQLEENYEGGVLNGGRTLWFPNRVLESNQNYVNGNRNGTFEWFSEKGELSRIEKFANDIRIDTAKIWWDSDTSAASVKIYSVLYGVDSTTAKEILSTRNLWFETIYNKKGENLATIGYTRKGQKENETIYYPDENKRVSRGFHENGTLRFESTYVGDKSVGLYKEYDENGKLTRSWEYDNDGRVIKETVKNY